MSSTISINRAPITIVSYDLNLLAPYVPYALGSLSMYCVGQTSRQILTLKPDDLNAIAYSMGVKAASTLKAGKGIYGFGQNFVLQAMNTTSAFDRSLLTGPLSAFTNETLTRIQSINSSDVSNFALSSAKSLLSIPRVGLRMLSFNELSSTQTVAISLFSAIVIGTIALKLERKNNTVPKTATSLGLGALAGACNLPILGYSAITMNFFELDTSKAFGLAFACALIGRFVLP